MRIALLMILLTLVAGCSGCSAVPSRAELKGTALRLEFVDHICSGTMRGPHELSTAKHCVKGVSKLVLVNDQKVEVVGWRETGPDSVIVSVRGVTFHNWPRTGVPHQGDRAFWWGQPLGARDVYREGYVAAVMKDGVVLGAAICHGDSGAGVFNERGELIGIISAMNNEFGCTFALVVSEGGPKQ